MDPSSLQWGIAIGRNAERLLPEPQPHFSTSESPANNPKLSIICSVTAEQQDSKHKFGQTWLYVRLSYRNQPNPTQGHNPTALSTRISRKLAAYHFPCYMSTMSLPRVPVVASVSNSHYSSTVCPSEGARCDRCLLSAQVPTTLQATALIPTHCRPSNPNQSLAAWYAGASPEMSVITLQILQTIY